MVAMTFGHFFAAKSSRETDALNAGIILLQFDLLDEAIKLACVNRITRRKKTGARAQQRDRSLDSES